jgi:protein ImuA
MNIASSLLSRRPTRADDGTGFLGDLTLRTGRVHEFCGTARRTLAMILAGKTAGPVFWIAPSWAVGGPNPDGFHAFADPSRFTFVAPRRPEDLLWCMEEVLRAGVVPLVVADLPAPPAMTPVRRLHLAAETGAAAGGTAPLGILLTPEGAAPGIESRWSLTPRHDGDTTDRWHLTRLRARTAPEAAWPLIAAPSGTPPCLGG